jgi:hypothetical protein
MIRSIEIQHRDDLTEAESRKLQQAITLLLDLSLTGAVTIFKDANRPVPLPQELIGGPARIYDQMVVGKQYLVADLCDTTGLPASTCFNMLDTLENIGVVSKIKDTTPRVGRPRHLYQLKETIT